MPAPREADSSACASEQAPERLRAFAEEPRSAASNAIHVANQSSQEIYVLVMPQRGLAEVRVAFALAETALFPPAVVTSIKTGVGLRQLGPPAMVALLQDGGHQQASRRHCGGLERSPP